MRARLSILDLAPITRGETAGMSFANSVALAQRAEQLGYERVWYAEHHNIPGIASSATSVLIAHIGAQTTTIRLGAGGVMLPNHAPLMIAEQFGTLAAMYPGRIDLGLGRAPGSDQNTMYALRRDPRSADAFPQDVAELQGYLTGNTRVPGVNAIPGKGSNVPLYILGSSLFGAKLAAAFGLPYAFASHFAPAALDAALAVYRGEFQPSGQLQQPYVIAGVNVVAADTAEAARQNLQAIRRARAVNLFGRGRGLAAGQHAAGQHADELDLTDEQADQLLAAGAAAQVDEMLTYAAVGTPREVSDYLDKFLGQTKADELITVHQAPNLDARLRSVTLLGEAVQGPALCSGLAVL
jgi:luciferase family oxidoreductase group 1